MPSSQAADQRCFLANTSVLEAVLLPHLDARAIMSLACTCRGLRAWICKAPPTIWQVRCRLKPREELVCRASTSSATAVYLQDSASFNVAAEYSATLPDTAAVLLALRKAHAALQNLKEGQEPVKQHVQPLEPLPGRRPDITDLRLAPNSALCALSYTGLKESCSSLGAAVDRPRRIAVYRVASDIRACTLLADSWWEWAPQWSPCGSWLSFARSRRSEGDYLCSLSSLSAEGWLNNDVASPPADTVSTWFSCKWGGAWAPNARHFAHMASQEGADRLYIRDAQQDSVVVWLGVSWTGPSRRMSVGWHPSSAGLVVLASICTLPIDAPLWNAGLATGIIPDWYMVSGKVSTQFSPQGDLLLATDSATKALVILSCRLQGSRYQFDRLPAVGRGSNVKAFWAPLCDHQACLWICKGPELVLWHVGREHPHFRLSTPGWVLDTPSVIFSPSGKQYLLKQRSASNYASPDFRTITVDKQLGVLPFTDDHGLFAWAPSGHMLASAPRQAGWHESPFMLLHYDMVGAHNVYQVCNSAYA